MGRVVRVLPGMQSAFIDIGGERAAFLHVADIWGHRENGADARPIERLLAEGQNLLVQVVKDPLGTKGARLSTQISIAGRLLVYLPQESRIGISQRIEDEAEREHLRDAAAADDAAGFRGGFIVRTMAEDGDRPRARCRRRIPAQVVEGIQEKAKSAAPAALLYQDLNLSQRVLRDFANEETARILIDSRETFQKVAGVRARVHAERRSAARALRGRAADIRSLQRRGRNRKGARPARRPQIRRLSDHRPDRGADDHRRQHRRLRRRPQLRRDDLQNQPRGGAGDRAPAAPEKSRRHHHHRLHRHGHRGAPQRGAERVPQGARAGSDADDGQRLHAAGPGRDDAQAHARERSPTCCASPARSAKGAAS